MNTNDTQKVTHEHGNWPSRVCHDCKTPTSNYRCPKCLKKWREKHKVSQDACDDSVVMYAL